MQPPAYKPLVKATEEHPSIKSSSELGTAQSMSQTTTSTIANSWSLIAFAKTNGPKMQVGSFVNKETSEAFKSCIFTNNDGDRTFVAFSSKMGVLSPKEIAAQKADLQVVQFESGHYCLCKNGENTWEDVDLGL